MIYIVYVLAALLLLILILAIVAPKQYHVERSISISRPLPEVFNYLRHIKNQNEWSPWKKRDPNMKQEFIGTDGEVGFISRWEGNKEVGTGEQEIINIVKNDIVEAQLRFFKPWKSESDAFTKVAEGANGETTVTWGFSGRNKVPINIFMMLYNVDKHVGKDFEEGLSDANTAAVIEFGETLQNTLHQSDSEWYSSKLNSAMFFEELFKSTPEIKPEEDFARGYVDGLSMSLEAFPKKIITDIENGAYYDFINYRYDPYLQTYFVLFRLYDPISGMNYHDYKLVKIDEDIQFSDMYIYLTGEYLSNTMGRLLSYSEPSFMELSNTAETSDSVKLFKALLFNRQGEYEMAYELLDSINSELSQQKFFIIFKILAAMQIDDDTYLESLEELIQTFPEDQTIALNRVDYHIFKGEYFEAIQVINRFQNEVEDDFLNFIKANIAFQDENYALAYNMYAYTIENYPGFFEAQAGFLNVLIMQENYQEAVEYLDTLLEEGYEKPGLEEYIESDDEFGVNILEAFSESEIYKNWKTKKP